MRADGEHNYRMVVAYEGTAYHGWQVQPNGITVQEVIQRALFRITGEKMTVHGSGRTDAGVHAWGQVASFRSHTGIPAARLQRGLNALLPDDVVVRSLGRAAADFHARKSARSKTYLYCLHNQPVADPFRRRFSWHLRRPLDLEALSAAAALLVGTHDFSSFKAADGETRSSVRTIYNVRCWRRGAGVYLLFKADGFLKNMVRVMVGTLCEIGHGRRSPREMAAIIAAGDRGRAGITAPPQGLVLRTVHYR